MAWHKRSVPCVGVVGYRGTMAPRVEEFDYLTKQGFAVTKEPDAKGHVWRLKLSHPEWGEAKVVCPREFVPPPDVMIDWQLDLTSEERQDAKQARTGVLLQMDARRGSMLRDRKCLLRVFRALMGDDGVMALDGQSERVWSRAALDEELAHDADVDVAALFTVHAVKTEKDGAVGWMHTHGLREIGSFDFDILRPSEDLAEGPNGIETLRAVAFAILEGNLTSTAPRFSLAAPGGVVRCVPVEASCRSASAADTALRGAYDADHDASRVILCQPVGGFLNRLLRRHTAPSAFLSRPMQEGAVIHFSSAATDLMAERAKGTWQVFCDLLDELGEFEFAFLAKAGYPTDSGGAGNREHLWFEVHSARGDTFDGTLVNRPIDVSRLAEGARGERPVEYVSDWTVFTPMGMISPRSATALRFIRANREKLLAVMREYRKEQAS